MADDVVTPSNPPIAPIEEEEFEEPPFDVNVSQQLREKKPFQRVVHTWIDHSMWDHQSSLNPHVLAIYLKFVPTHGTALERF